MEELRVDAAEQPLAASLSARTTPFVMRGAAKAWGWRAAERWSSAEALVAHYGDFEMDLADDVRLPLREYVEYAANNAADSPYYLVERSFQGERAALLDDFAPPSFFADDLLAEIPGSKRARYCFFGGARSGTFLHVDAANGATLLVLDGFRFCLDDDRAGKARALVDRHQRRRRQAATEQCCYYEQSEQHGSADLEAREPAERSVRLMCHDCCSAHWAAATT